MNAQATAVRAAGTAEAGLLDQIVEQSKVAKSESEHQRARDIISELAREVLQGTVVVSENLNLTLDARVAELDRMISEQLTAVMHAPEFQQLESTWRGLHYLCGQTSTGAQLKIKVLNAPKRDVVKDFKAAIDFDQSALFKKVYEEEFGTFGGSPFGTLIGDYQIGRQPEDMYF
ncbi:MAG: type VI secretion system contractile sheath large subunit, partial [Lysobacter spongiicola]|nr:type VI secretion system contractile sheath large subunit [Lysobacter spongiicola]